ncbi:MAG: PspC domain-containing protein [Chitinophagales bacterium]
MKKTISINLAGLVYQIDEDAFSRLETYLEKIRHAFPEPSEQEEILSDIEYRFAELFTEKLGKRTEVVHLKMVQEAIDTMGEIEFINEETSTSSATNHSAKEKIKRKLFRSVDDKILGGVLGGLSVYLGIEAVWLRLIFVLLAIASIGIPVGIIYALLWLILPKAVTASQKLQMHGEPVNLNNLQENLKKNLSSESIKSAGSNIASGVGELIRVGLKLMAAVLGFIILFHLVVFSFVWFIASFFLSFMAGDFIALIFNSNLEFLALSTTLFILAAIPSLLAIYFIYKVRSNHTVPWAKASFIGFFTWILNLFLAILLVFNVLKEFKTSATTENYLNIPFTTDLEEISIDFKPELAQDQFNFYFEDGEWQTEGFFYDASDSILKLNTISLQVKASEDSTFSLLAMAKSNGRTKEQAEKHLEKFSYEVEWLNNKELVIPTTLLLEGENKFRLQRLIYVLEVPIGTTINFKNGAHYFISKTVLESSAKKKDLDENTWLMTRTGLECLSCVKDSLTEEIGEPNSLEEALDSLDDKIEELIEDKLN